MVFLPQSPTIVTEHTLKYPRLRNTHIPVNGGEETVPFYLLCAISTRSCNIQLQLAAAWGVCVSICEHHVQEMILTQSVGGVPLEQSPEQRLGLDAQELRHSQARPAGRDRRHGAQIISPDIKRGVLFQQQHFATAGRLHRVLFLCLKNTHFRIRFMVSLRSFPWNGSAPVNISNWETENTTVICMCKSFVW